MLWKRTCPKTYCHGNEKVSRGSCYGLASCSTWSVCVSVRLHLCMCVRLRLCMCLRLYLCMCVRLYLGMCVRLHLYMCVTTTLSNEELTKIKVLDLDEFYNFYIHDFFSLNHLGYQNMV